RSTRAAGQGSPTGCGPPQPAAPASAPGSRRLPAARYRPESPARRSSVPRKGWCSLEGQNARASIKFNLGTKWLQGTQVPALQCCAGKAASAALEMTPKEKNYWLDTVQMPETDPSLWPPERVDVAVIGAGFTGLSAGRTLAKRGAKVAICEAETIGWGASSRNGGMVLTGMKLGVNKLISMYGREKAQQMYAASLESIECVEQIVREEKIDCNFSRCRSEEHTSELQSRGHLVCRLLLEKKKNR